jgi:SAM-dependent methyltransferase
MDPTTDAVRAMYEAYPYPAVAEPEIRLGTNARLLLSYGVLARSRRRPLHCLDAGCGRANGSLGAAATQPDVQFTAIDMNRRALADAAQAAARMGLRNITFHEVDLMTLEGLEVPDGGFDVIVSSGVLHHLASPDAGLAHLRRVLAPHGVLSVMVYGAMGREPLYRMVKAVDLLVGRDRPIAERLAMARRLATDAHAEAVRVGPVALTDTMHDNEFVDRYLNVNETAYDVASLFALLGRHDLRFLRWIEPAEWVVSPRREGSAGVADHLSDLERFQIVEQLTWRHKLSLVVGTAENAPRVLPPRDEWTRLPFAVNPDVSFQATTRTLRGSQRLEHLAYQLRARPAAALTGLAASLAAAIKDKGAPFQGREALALLATQKVGHDDALEVVADLVAREIVYMPHPADA